MAKLENRIQKRRDATSARRIKKHIAEEKAKAKAAVDAKMRKSI